MAEITEITHTEPPDPIVVRLDRLEAGQTDIKADVAALGTKVAALDTKVAALDTKVGDLDRHMHVLHENVLERIAAISEHPLATKADLSHAVARIEQIIDRRIVPLEAAVRTLSRVRRAKRG